jgi:hypothetical protein
MNKPVVQMCALCWSFLQHEHSVSLVIVIYLFMLRRYNSIRTLHNVEQKIAKYSLSHLMCNPLTVQTLIISIT